MYPDDYKGPRFDWPPYDRVSEPLGAAAHCRNQYGALLTMCDTYLGKLLDYMDAHDMWNDTMLIVATDHGFLLGEHGWWAKNRPPFYEELSHTPLFIWDPREKIAGERRNGIGADDRSGANIAGAFWNPPCKGYAGMRSASDNPERQAGAHWCAVWHVWRTYLRNRWRYVYMRADRPGKPYMTTPASAAPAGNVCPGRTAGADTAGAVFLYQRMQDAENRHAKRLLSVHVGGKGRECRSAVSTCRTIRSR